MSEANRYIPVEMRLKHPIGLQVHAILWKEWNPIGVDESWPDDEYDGYVWPIIAKVMRGETIEQVADYLDWAAGEHMECPLPRQTHLALARKLVALRPRETS
ncbi:MAG: hypothetical protein ABI306_09045 [Caulobacteraceae bacterium]